MLVLLALAASILLVVVEMWPPPAVEEDGFLITKVCSIANFLKVTNLKGFPNDFTNWHSAVVPVDAVGPPSSPWKAAQVQSVPKSLSLLLVHRSNALKLMLFVQNQHPQSGCKSWVALLHRIGVRYQSGTVI